MPADFDSEKVNRGDPNDSNPFNDLVDLVEAALNALFDTTKTAAGADEIIDPAKLAQTGAASGQWITWGDYDAEVMADSPKAYWKCEEASGNLVDATAGAHTATANGAISYHQPGIRDFGVKPDGSTGFFTVADHADLDLGDALTLVAWVNPVLTGDFQRIFDKGGNAYEFRLGSDGKIDFAKSGVAVITTSTSAVPLDGQMHRVAVTKNGATVKLYIDKTDVTGSVVNQTLSDNTNNLLIGKWAGGSFGFLASTVDSLAIYNTALSQARLDAQFDAAYWRPTTPPAAPGAVMLSTQKLSADTPTIDFPSISGSYKHLLLVGSIRSDRVGGGGIDDLSIRLNNDSGASQYDAYTLGVNSNTPDLTSGGEQRGQTRMVWQNALVSADSLDKLFTTFTAFVPHYTGTANNKIIVADLAVNRGQSSGTVQTFLGMGAWRASSAINQITFSPVNGSNLISGSHITLYGLP